MLCYDTDSHKIVKVPGLKVKDVESFGKALGAIRTFDKGSGEINIPVNAGRILKFRTTFDLYPEQEK